MGKKRLTPGDFCFELDEDEIIVFNEWQKEQIKKQGGEHSVNGGRWSFIFTKTSIGLLVEAKDNETNEIKLLTNLENW